MVILIHHFLGNKQSRLFLSYMVLLILVCISIGICLTNEETISSGSGIFNLFKTTSIQTNSHTLSTQGWPWDLDLRPQGHKVSGESTYTENKATVSVMTGTNGRIPMGIASQKCDDAKTNLEMDWDGSPVTYTCFHPEKQFPLDTTLQPLMECVTLPSNYLPRHFCMNESIHYDDDIPTYGDHRPLWPKFGEYVYVPPQRWLHNIEHGAVVMLYHPCTHPQEVKRLRHLLTNCYGKHVISPSRLLSKERPMALIAWGCRLLLATADDANFIINFIKVKGMKGPEGTYTKEGQYEMGLIQSALLNKGNRYDQFTCPKS